MPFWNPLLVICRAANFWWDRHFADQIFMPRHAEARLSCATLTFTLFSPFTARQGRILPPGIVWTHLKIYKVRPKIAETSFIHAKSYNLIMIMKRGTTVRKKVRICADFAACWYLLIFLSSIADLLSFQPGNTGINPSTIVYKLTLSDLRIFRWRKPRSLCYMR